jgi:dihydroxyacetone kinase-like protein
MRFHELVDARKTYLTELDSAIGDADHGINMSRGMDAVVAKIGATSPTTIGEFFKTVGMTLISSVGGASGPLYGTFFLRFGSSAADATALDGAGLSAALHAAADGIVARGKAELDDKTLFDALSPAVAAFDTALAAGSNIGQCSDAARDAAERGRDATEPLLARKGRASYLGERSVGHLDPGSVSMALLFTALATTFSPG